MIYYAFAVIFVTLCGLFARQLQASELPVWEFGVGVGSYETPHYLGADESSRYVLPLPYAVYRGEYLKTGSGGLAGEIYDSVNLDIRISLGGALPVNSADSEARRGMDSLGLVLEFGPTLQATLYERHRHLLRFDVPVRAAVSFGDDIGFQGLTTNPRFLYRHRVGHWRLSSSLGPSFGSTRYHAYIYDVPEKNAKPSRPAYDSHSGYTGMHATFGLSHRFGPINIGGFLNYYNISGARNHGSPLVKTDNYLAVGMGVTWVFFKSQLKVSDRMED